MKDEPKYPTPSEFVRKTQGLDANPSSVAPSINMSILQNLTSTGKLPTIGEQIENQVESSFNWCKHIQEILNSDMNSVEDEAHGLYKIEIAESENEKQTFFIDLSAKHKIVFEGNKLGKEPDVSVNVSSIDLANILNGSLAPLQAYLTGRITAQGDVRKLMFFDKLSKRSSHKPGSMFNI